MKIIRIVLALSMIVLMLAPTAFCVAEQTLPGVAVFSPGLVRLSDRMRENPAVHMEAALFVEDAFYVRDTSVLSAMLDETSFVYDGAQRESGPIDRIRIVRGSETLFDAQMTSNMLALNGEGFALEGALIDPRMQAVLDSVQMTAILERAPLAEVESFLLSLKEGMMLFGGFAVVQPFDSVRTMSDDGTRLTRINITGSIAREGEAPWVVKGYLKQPAGRAPKDTFELTATQDEKNWLELSYSSLRQSEITKKNRAGQASVDTNVKIAGEIDGYRVSERLSSRLRNTWTADGENLSERIVVNMTLEHSDNTPGREMQRMNRAEANMRHEIRMTTTEAGNDVFDLTDAITLSLVMDDNTVLDVGADAVMQIGGKMPDAGPLTVQAPKEKKIERAIEEAVGKMAAGIFAQLTDTAKEKVLTGLNEEP